MFSASNVNSRLVNITVDDTIGDPSGRSLLQYSPATHWKLGHKCLSCHIHPSEVDLSQTFDGTWHHGTSTDSPATITIQFTGSEVYIFNMLTNKVPSTTTLSKISFSLDGEDVGHFTHSPKHNSASILYNQLVYRNTLLKHGQHTLTMTAHNNSLILFDYALYATQFNDTALTDTSNVTPSSSTPGGSSQPSLSGRPTVAETPLSPSSTTPVGAIVGAILGVIAILLGVGAGVFVLGRRCKRRRCTPMEGSPTNVLSFEDNNDGYGERSSSEDLGDGGEVFAQPMVSQITAIAPFRSLDGIAAHDGSLGLVPNPQLHGTDSALHTSLCATIAASSEPSSMDRSSKHRAELAQRLEVLQRRRSILSSRAPSESQHSRSEVSREGGTEAAIRDLEAEITRLRGILSAMNVQFVDGHDSDEPLPAYTE